MELSNHLNVYVTESFERGLLQRQVQEVQSSLIETLNNVDCG